MSLNYSIAMMGNPLKKEEPKKAYAKAQTNGELNLKELSTLIASKCTVHQAVTCPKIALHSNNYKKCTSYD